MAADNESVPGFIALRSRSEDGQTSLSVSHITTVGPSRRDTRSGNPECTITMENGSVVVANLRRQDVLLLIAESIGAVPVGTGAQLSALRSRMQDNNRRLRQAADELRAVTEQVTALAARDADRVTSAEDAIRKNTQRLADILAPATKD